MSDLPPQPPPLPPRVPPAQVMGYAAPMPAASDPNAAEKWLLPVGRSGWAIAAGYAGLFAFVFFPAPIALVLGIVAVLDLRKHPELSGRGRAWFGLIAGAVFTLPLIAMVVALLSKR